MHIFRENTEDIYAGIEWEQGTPEAQKFYTFLHDEMGVSKVRFPRDLVLRRKTGLRRREQTAGTFRHPVCLAASSDFRHTGA